MFVTPVQIRFSDIDGFHHVNNSFYSQYLDCGRVAYFHHLFGGYFFSKTRKFVLVRIENNFLRPTLLTDIINVHTSLALIGERSVSMRQQIISDKEELRVESVSVLSTFDVDTQGSFVIPADWREILSSSL